MSKHVHFVEGHGSYNIRNPNENGTKQNEME